MKKSDESPVTFHVLSHTHWDREWYLTFEQFRLRLVDLIDHLIELEESDPNFLHFHLDAQTIVLEDYLKIRPHREALLKRLISEKRIGVGPWYQLNDEFLTSPESTVRSLLIGNRIAKRFGHCLKIGYLPDQFGNIGQMPQILKGFGIDNVVFGRGWGLRNGRKLEFFWEAPDGSRALTSFMAFWYNNAERFPSDPDEARAFVDRIEKTMAPHSETNQLLLMNGVDHFEAQDDLSAILGRLAPALKEEGKTILHSRMEDYIDSIRPYSDRLEAFKGELREDWGGQCLAGTLSSRTYLKQANDRCQTLLERMAEPSAAWSLLAGGEYPLDVLTYAWKLLMENHPHDSICGCSVDAVHDENMTRYHRVEELGEELYQRSTLRLASQIKTEAAETVVSGGRKTNVVVFNPTTFDRTDTVEVTIDFPLGDKSRGVPEIDRSLDVTSLEIVDANDEPVPFNLLDSRIDYARYLSPIVLPMVGAVRRFKIRLLAKDVPGSGYATYKAIAKGGSAPVPDNPCAKSLNELENEHLTAHIATLTKDSLSIASKAAWVYLDLNQFESVGDVGDEYRYVAPLKDRRILSTGALKSVSLEEAGPAGATYRLDYEMIVPESAEADGSKRSERMTTIDITSWVRLAPGMKRVEIKTKVVNRAKDHRLRAIFSTGLNVDESHSEGHFEVTTRPVRPPKEWGPDAAPYYPQQSWCEVSADEELKDGVRRFGFAVLNKGLREYELYDDDERTLAITLLRCVERISGGGDAPGAEVVPGAQCLGTYEFEYALYPHAGDWKDGEVWREAHAFATPLRAVQTDDHDGSLPPTGRFMEISSPEFVITAIKGAEPDSEGERVKSVVVRGYNISDQPLENVRIRLYHGASCALANLNEEPTESLTVANEEALIPVIGPKKIVTLRWEIDG